MMSFKRLPLEVSQFFLISGVFLFSITSLLAMDGREKGGAAAIGGEERAGGGIAPRVYAPYDGLSTAEAIVKCTQRMDLIAEVHETQLGRLDKSIQEVKVMSGIFEDYFCLVKKRIQQVKETSSYLPRLLAEVVGDFVSFMRGRAVSVLAAECACSRIAASSAGDDEISVGGFVPLPILLAGDPGEVTSGLAAWGEKSVLF